MRNHVNFFFFICAQELRIQRRLQGPKSYTLVVVATRFHLVTNLST